MFFPAKILLIGEHSVLHGSQSLSIPFGRFGGQWTFDQEADERLLSLVAQLDKSIIDVDRFVDDCKKGLRFDSTIPIKYGLGSSGALTAAINKTYAFNQETTINDLQHQLASIESIFHGKSSGTDALVSYCDAAIHSIDNSSIILKTNPLDSFSGYVYLFDSKIDRSAKTYIQRFGQLVNDGDIDIKRLNVLCDAVIETLISPTTDQVVFKTIKLLSQFQYDHLEALIPKHVRAIWAEGLESDRYYFKLCGAGGGGYFLVFAPSSLEYIQDVKLISLHSDI